MPAATASTRAQSSGTASSGTASSGTASSGTASNGTASNGTASSGTASSGTASNGAARPRWRDASFSPLAAVAIALCAPIALLSVPMAIVAIALVVVATMVDAGLARRPPDIGRSLPLVLSRGVPVPLRAWARGASGRVQVRQPLPPDIDAHLTVAGGGARRPGRHGLQAKGELDAVIVGKRRGVHPLPCVAVLAEGPLRLGRWYHRSKTVSALMVYPDLHTARRIAEAVRTNRFAMEGQRRRGPLGLGTEFEAVREYRPDDDVRQINWKATGRLGRPHANTFRVDQDRDVFCCVDTGRLMGTPLSGATNEVPVTDPASSPDIDDAIDFIPERNIGVRTVAGPEQLTRLDAALDAVVAIARVSEILSDRCGLIAYDQTIRRRVPPTRRGGDSVENACLELEPSTLDSDHTLGLRAVSTTKRGVVFVFVDLVESVAVTALCDALPELVRRHNVIVVSTTDGDVEAIAALDSSSGTQTRSDAKHTKEMASVPWRSLVARDLLAARHAAGDSVRQLGARVIVGPPDNLANLCVEAYLAASPRTSSQFT